MNSLQQDYDLLFKTLLIGNSGVGKSSFVLRFSDNVFEQNYLPTIGVDFKMSKFFLQGNTIKMQIWDTAGQERFRTITSSYYKGAHGIILIYDITDRQSFKDIENWVLEVEKFSNENITRLLVGNKSDLGANRQVSFDEGQQLADRLGIRFIEASAKSDQNVEQTFKTMAQDIKNKIKANHKPQPLQQKIKDPKILEQSFGCC